MKTTNRIFIALTTVLLLFSTISFAQDEAAEEPPQAAYYAVTTMHWNMDYEDFDLDTWKAVEKEFLDNVTMKNEHILFASFYFHHTSADNTEILYVQGFESWEAIHNSAARNNELATEAWPDEEARDAYFDKRGAYYANKHSDEIYAVTSGAKTFAEDPKDGAILHIRRNYRAFPKDGSNEEFNELRDSYIENIINKNEFIKAWFPSAHYYGADSTERVTATFFDSLADFDKHYDRNGELAKEAWPDDEARSERGKRVSKYWTGVHGDYIYTFVGGLNK